MAPEVTTNSHRPSDAELGRQICQLREQADMRQAHLARRITWSPAVMSRVEAGERSLTSEELQAILEAIGTPDALRLGEFLDREWAILERPDLDHPDQDLLFDAERVAVELQRLIESPNVRLPFVKRVHEYIDELRRISRLLLRRDHQIAFVGSIGIGKSTAICKVTGLQVLDKNGESVPVLEIGGGGVTLCEVHLRSGLGYGLVIEPRSDEEIRADVADFVEHLLRGDRLAPSDAKSETDSARGIAHEIDRAIRNMAGLRVRRSKEDGKTVRVDEAKELAEEISSARELVVEILARMELHRRDRRDLWYDGNTKEAPLRWLQDIFEAVNNGRHPEVSLPKRVELVVPQPLLDIPGLNISIIDTRGIDQAASRGDIEAHLEEPHTISLLCSAFNAAPSVELQVLLGRAKDVGNTIVGTNSAILVLPRPEEALAVKDEAGIAVESVEEGYELKSEQVSTALEPLGVGNLGVGFFNAISDDPVRLHGFLAERVTHVREKFRGSLQEVVESGWMLLKNHEQEQVQAVLRDAGQLLRTWFDEHDEPASVEARPQDSLMNALEELHPSTIHACMRRRGEWQNLSYSHQLGHGARRVAAFSLGDHVSKFRDYCKTLSKSKNHAEARELLLQAGRVLGQLYEELLRRVQLLGQNLYQDDLRKDAKLWADCEGEWGEGSGYRKRVAQRNRRWFDATGRRHLETELLEVIQREWSQAAAHVSSLVAVD